MALRSFTLRYTTQPKGEHAMPNKIEDRSRRSFLAAGATLVAASGIGANSTAAQPADTSGISVSTIADALKRVGRDPMSLAMSSDVRPQTSIAKTLIGPAVTTKWQAGEGRMSPDDVRNFMFEPLDDAAVGSIWVVAGGTERMLSLFGGVIGVACKRNGIAAAVTDNACRDIATFEDAGFPVFARAVVPYGPGTFARPVAANVPVECGGVTINPGDLVAADRDGVIVVPQEVYADVLDAAADIRSKEQRVLGKIAAGEPLAKAYTI
jgi:4-hydroxy-4-methyl-2-oxoglutarate aldolase